MSAFIKEYVLVQLIPIPRLLYAFGVCLVSIFSKLHVRGSQNEIPVPGTETKKAKDVAVFPQGCAFTSASCQLFQAHTTPTDIHFRLQQRQKIQTLNTIDDAVDLIQKSKQILILTGAGISV